MPKVRLNPRSEERSWQARSTLAGPALTALLLLAPAAVVPVPDEVRTAALAAVMNLAGLDHRYPPLQG